jgi:hypothetical protein
MRKAAFVIMLLAFATGVVAQERDAARGDSRNESFFGPVIKFTTIKGQAGVMFGLRGSWPIGRSLALGGTICTLMSKVDAPEGALPLEGALDIDLSYLGFELEYFLNPGSRTRFSLSALFGGGATRYVKDTGSFFKSNEQSGETAFMFIVEPGGNAEWTVAKWLRLMAGVSYRLVSGTRQEKLTDQDLGGPVVTIAFKF